MAQIKQQNKTTTNMSMITTPRAMSYFLITSLLNGLIISISHSADSISLGSSIEKSLSSEPLSALVSLDPIKFSHVSVKLQTALSLY